MNTFRKYFYLFLRYRWDFALGVLTLALTNLLAVSIPWLMKAAVNSLGNEPVSLPAWLTAVLTDSAGAMFPRLLMLIVGIALTMMVVRVISRIYLIGAGRKIEYDLKNALYRHLLKMPQSYYSLNTTGDLMSRMTNDVQAVRYMCAGGVMLSTNILFVFGLSLPMMYLISPKLTGLALLVFPTGMLLMALLSRRVKASFYKVQAILGDISDRAQENLSGMSVIQSFVREGFEAKQFRALCQSYFEVYQKMIRERAWVFLFAVLIWAVSFLLTLAEGGREVILGELTLGDFIAFTLYLERLNWPTMTMGWVASVFQQGLASLERLDEVLSVDPDRGRVTPLSGQVSSTPYQSGDITFNHLTFSYENPYMKQRQDQMLARSIESQPSQNEIQKMPALADISLALPRGETVALVGPVACGKSTLLKLMTRIYEPPENSILIGGVDITRLDIAELRRHVVLMSQQSFLFSNAIDRNIAYGAPQSEFSAVTAMAETAAVHDEILAMEAQYATIVGERGITLSGGQRQRVSLARTLLVSPDILLLDDPFSSIDAETEQEIIRALYERKIFREKTTLIATHRLSIVNHVDRIVLMDAGKIVAQGSHETLIKTQPLYQRLHRMETLRKELGDNWTSVPGPEQSQNLEASEYHD